MTTPAPEPRILGYYESIGRLSQTMVVAAERADWEALAAAERICGLLIERIEAFGDPELLLDASARRRRLAILRRLLADDAQIRRHTQPSLARVDRLLAGPVARGRGG